MIKRHAELRRTRETYWNELCVMPVKQGGTENYARKSSVNPGRFDTNISFLRRR